MEIDKASHGTYKSKAPPNILVKIRRTLIMLIATTATIFVGCAGVSAEPFVGQVMITASSFCPRGWVEANGQLIAISSNEALFSLYGTTYGGDGRTSFGLPDLRGRIAIHKGEGPGLLPRELGSSAGSDFVSITEGNKETYAGPPSLALLYCVAYVGIYPSRN
ncbi:MAG: phage tail protein [Hyphomicrobiales bacterium]